MARHIDELLAYVRSRTYLSDVEKQVLITRIDVEPSKEEIEIAAKKITASRQAWKQQYLGD